MKNSIIALLETSQAAVQAERSVGAAIEVALADNTAQAVADALGVDRVTVYRRLAKYRGTPYRQGIKKD